MSNELMIVILAAMMIAQTGMLVCLYFLIRQTLLRQLEQAMIVKTLITIVEQYTNDDSKERPTAP